MDALSFRRRLRRRSTDAEKRLWNALRHRRFRVKFRRQHPLGPYLLDLYCPEARLAVEADGDPHVEEAHRAADAVRDAYLASQGIRVLRFTDRQILTETMGVLEAIREALEDRPLTLPLSPTGAGERGKTVDASATRGPLTARCDQS